MAIHLVVYDSEGVPSPDDILLFLSFFPEFSGNMLEGDYQSFGIKKTGLYTGVYFHLRDETYDFDKLFVVMGLPRKEEGAPDNQASEMVVRLHHNEIKEILKDWLVRMEAVEPEQLSNLGTRMQPFVITGRPGYLRELVAEYARGGMRAV